MPPLGACATDGNKMVFFLVRPQPMDGVVNERSATQARLVVTRGVMGVATDRLPNTSEKFATHSFYQILSFQCTQFMYSPYKLLKIVRF